MDFQRRLRQQSKRWVTLQYDARHLYNVAIRACAEPVYKAITGDKDWRDTNNRKDLFALLAIMKKVCNARQQDATKDMMKGFVKGECEIKTR